MTDETPKARKPAKQRQKAPPLPPPIKNNEPGAPLPILVGEDIREGMSDAELVVAFNNLKHRLDDEKKYRRTTTFALGLAVFLAMVLGLGLFLVQQGRNSDRVSQNRIGCNHGNELREKIRGIGTTLNNRIDNYGNVLIAASSVIPAKNAEDAKNTQLATAEFKRLSNLDSIKVKNAIDEIKDLDCNKLYR